jgi:hypothetical protein
LPSVNTSLFTHHSGFTPFYLCAPRKKCHGWVKSGKILKKHVKGGENCKPI